MPYRNPMDFSIGPKHITKYTRNHIFLSKYTNAHYTHPKDPSVSIPLRNQELQSLNQSRTQIIVAGPAVVEIRAPLGTLVALDVVTVGIFG